MFFFLMMRPPPISTLFPYTTLFRSIEWAWLSRRYPSVGPAGGSRGDRKSTRLNSSHRTISYAVFCLKKKKVSSQAREFFSRVDARKLGQDNNPTTSGSKHRYKASNA